MKIIKSYLTKNLCYTNNIKIKVKGLMLHSVGCPQPSAQVFANAWNSPTMYICTHAVIDGNSGDIYQFIPWDNKGWHGGGTSNNTHIGVEMGEPNTIKYTQGASWYETGDGINTKETVLKTYNSAVYLFGYLCNKFNLNPLEKGVIVSHSEGHTLGIASGHADVEHIWNKFGLSMDKFRQDVSNIMGKLQEKQDNNNIILSEISSNTSTSATQTPTKSESIYRVQIGAFSSKEYAINLQNELKKKNITGIIKQVSTNQVIYRVQVGAFSNINYAVALRDKLKALGYTSAFIVKS